MESQMSFLQIPPTHLFLDLKSFYNRILDAGKFHEDWKIDKKIPIYKKGDKLDPGHYRPVAIH